MFSYKTHGTCATKILLELDGDIITKCEFENGCMGNTVGISSLVVGMKAQDVISRISGIICDGSDNQSSCPAQLSLALEKYLDENGDGKDTLIGVGAQARIYKKDGCAQKVFAKGVDKSAVYIEAIKMAIVENLGVSIAKPMEILFKDGAWVLTMDYIPGDTWGSKMQSGLPAAMDILKRTARLQADINKIKCAHLPNLKQRLYDEILRLSDAYIKEKALYILERLPDGDKLCHFDFHPMNIMGTLDAPVIIDWCNASTGHPAADAARTILLLQTALPKEIIDIYTGEYMHSSGVSAEEIQSWLPVAAAARLSENVATQKDTEIALRLLEKL